MIDVAPVNLVNAVTRALKKYPLRLRSLSIPIAHSPDDEEILLSLAGSSHEVLLKARTVFPFDFFPDTITLDREKLSIINRFFFWTARITSVPVRDILSVEADVGPFFGSIRITSRYDPVKSLSINFLWRKDALLLRKLLQGYIIAHERNLECSKIKKPELVYLLNELGQGEIE
jgi:hypothetical protein